MKQFITLIALFMFAELVVGGSPIKAQESYTGLSLGISGAMTNGKFDKDFRLEAGRSFVVKRENLELTTMPATQYSGLTGVVGIGNITLGTVKTFKIGKLMLGGDVFPFEASTTDELVWNKSVSGGFIAMFKFKWQDTQPWLRLQFDWTSPADSDGEVKERAAKQIVFGAGIEF